jgi:hypothetical protein
MQQRIDTLDEPFEFDDDTPTVRQLSPAVSLLDLLELTAEDLLDELSIND